MQLSAFDFPFTLLTPCFSGTALGKHDDHAEMRIPPIRGHVRLWHRALYGSPDANRVWGNTNGNEGQGSRVALRFLGRVSDRHESPKPTLLPHKPNPNHRGPRAALATGESFTLRLQRLVGCANHDWDHAQRAVKLWLLLGSLGLRSNRAAGSVWPEGNWVPRDADSLKTTLAALGLADWSVAVIGLDTQNTPEELRETASDTVAGSPHSRIFGRINPQRMPSPTKFKVARLGAGHCLLACAPREHILDEDRQRRTILHEAQRLLTEVKPSPQRWEALGSWNYILE